MDAPCKISVKGPRFGHYVRPLVKARFFDAMPKRRSKSLAVASVNLLAAGAKEMASGF